jgi:hypothetical protein
MSKSYPIVPSKREAVAPRGHPVPAAPRRRLIEPVAPVAPLEPFFNFHYSYTEISSLGGKTHVKGRRATFDGTKLTNESFDGDLDGGAYERMVDRAREQFAAQVSWLVQPLAWLLGSGRRD